MDFTTWINILYFGKAPVQANTARYHAYITCSIFKLDHYIDRHNGVLGQQHTKRVLTDLEFVANADEAEFTRFLFGVLGGAGVLKQLANKFVFWFTHQTLQGHVEGVIILLHEPRLSTKHIHFCSEKLPLIHSDVVLDQNEEWATFSFPCNGNKQKKPQINNC